jgi:DNA-binding CsgD family transcriptional regulator
MNGSIPHWLADDFDPDRVLDLREQPCVALADERGAIVGAFVACGETHRDYAELLGHGRSEPSTMLAVAIRTAFSEWAGPREPREAFVFFMTPSIIARIMPLSGPTHLAAISLERVNYREMASGAIARFGISRRETDIVKGLFSGLSAADMARELQISEMTVQGHVKRILAKTKSKTRTEMVAKLLGWRAGR